MNAYYSQLAQQQIKGTTANFSPTFVQFIFNLGFRAQLSRHNGIELGVKIPTIDNPYYTYSSPKENAAWGVAGASKTTIRFRRNVAAYLNYVYHF